MKLMSLGRFLVVGAAAIVAAAACTSGGESDENGDGDGDGDATGSGGTAGDGDGSGGTTTGDGDGDGADGAVACAPATEAMLLDFTYDASGMGGAAPSEVEGDFGDQSTTLSGGTFQYPEGLTSDVTGGDWHIAGTVNEFAGFGLYFSHAGAGCSLVDASAYQGITLTISGDAGPGPVRLAVGTAENEIASSWFEAQGETADPNFGECEPTSGQYDGTCGAPGYDLPAVTNSPQTINIMWSDLTGGSPADTVDPSEITFITWTFAWADGQTPYDVDITVDDIGFIE